MSGYFGQKAQYSTGGGDFEPAEAGVYTCKFRDIEEFQEGSFNDPMVQEDKFRFRFETADPEDVNAKGEAFRFSKKTGIKYGNDKAALTLLLDAMVGRRMTVEEFIALDLDILRACNYSITVDAKAGNDGRVWNNITGIARVRRARQAPPQGQQSSAPKPNYQPKPAPAKVAPTTDLDSDFQDPFDE